jgi:hypothetical protein
MKYKFNKNIFRVWLALILICVLAPTFLNYSDYKEYDVSCHDTQCHTNMTMFEGMYILEDNRREDRPNVLVFSDSSILGDDYLLYSGERIIYSNYEKTPYIIKNAMNIIFLTLFTSFGLNHLWYRKEVKDDKDKS